MLWRSSHVATWNRKMTKRTHEDVLQKVWGELKGQESAEENTWRSGLCSSKSLISRSCIKCKVFYTFGWSTSQIQISIKLLNSHTNPLKNGSNSYLILAFNWKIHITAEKHLKMGLCARRFTWFFFSRQTVWFNRGYFATLTTLSYRWQSVLPRSPRSSRTSWTLLISSKLRGLQDWTLPNSANSASQKMLKNPNKIYNRIQNKQMSIQFVSLNSYELMWNGKYTQSDTKHMARWNRPKVHLTSPVTKCFIC